MIADQRRVMLLTSSLCVGGAERVIAVLARNLDRARFAVTVAHLKERGEIGEELAAQGLDVVQIPHRTRGVGRYLSSLALSRVMRDRGIELLHTHTTEALTEAALRQVATRSQVRLVHTFHFGNYPKLPRRYRLMERIASRAASHLVAVGHEQMKALRSLYGIAPDGITTILNGTESPLPAVDQEWAARLAGAGRVVIGTNATFIEQKGLDYILDVAKIFERDRVGAVFVVAGDGPLRVGLEARCRAMGLQDSVLFAGWKANADATMTPLYDVLFLPSRWEAMSMVVLEAMAAQRPVVATDVGDNRHVVVDGATGFIVKAHDVDAMAERLRTLVESSSLCRQLGADGRRRYEERYTAQVMTRAYENLFWRLLEGPATL